MPDVAPNVCPAENGAQEAQNEAQIQLVESNGVTANAPNAPHFSSFSKNLQNEPKSDDFEDTDALDDLAVISEDKATKLIGRNGVYAGLKLRWYDDGNVKTLKGNTADNLTQYAALVRYDLKKGKCLTTADVREEFEEWREDGDIDWSEFRKKFGFRKKDGQLVLA